MPTRGRTTSPPPSGPPGVAAAAPPAKPQAEPPANPPAKRRRSQAEPRTEALLTSKDLGTGTIHWNGLLAMLTMINESGPATKMVQQWLTTHNEQRGGEKTRKAMLGHVKAHIAGDGKVPVCGTATVQNCVAFSLNARDSQQPKGPTTKQGWVYRAVDSTGKHWYTEKPRTKKVPASAAASPACDRGPALRETVAYHPPRTATICVKTTSSLELTHVQLRKVPFVDQWCGAVPNHSEVEAVEVGEQGGNYREWTKIRWPRGTSSQEGWVKSKYVTLVEDTPLGNPPE
jgi:hypothetical protein